jgi:hypothetical protein
MRGHKLQPHFACAAILAQGLKHFIPNAAGNLPPFGLPPLTLGPASLICPTTLQCVSETGWKTAEMADFHAILSLRIWRSY